ncbi:MAG: hypothetical protein V4520_02380 [Bacteroidota bacterium]
MSEEIKCPKCASNQLTANKKGFSGGKAVAGALLTGGIGLLAGTIGSNKVIITCLNCGNQFKPGEHKKNPAKTIDPSIAKQSTKFVSVKGANEPKLIWDEASKSYINNPKYVAPESATTILLVLIIVVVAVVLLIKFIS